MTPLPRIALLLAGCMLAGSAAAGADQSLQAIEQVAVAQVRSAAPADARVLAQATTLDARLRLAACAQPLQSRIPGGRIRGNRVSVEVSCAAPRAWSLRVGVRVQIFRKVLVTTRALARMDSIGADDVTLRERDVSRLGYGYLSTLEQASGHPVARPLRAGTVLTPAMLAHREVVRRGDKVTVMVDISGIRVRAAGVALAGGDAGERVQVRNVSSGRTLDATVVGSGVVRALP